MAEMILSRTELDETNICMRMSNSPALWPALGVMDEDRREAPKSVTVLMTDE